MKIHLLKKLSLRKVFGKSLVNFLFQSARLLVRSVHWQYINKLGILHFFRVYSTLFIFYSVFVLFPLKLPQDYGFNRLLSFLESGIKIHFLPVMAVGTLKNSNETSRGCWRNLKIPAIYRLTRVTFKPLYVWSLKTEV